MKRNFPSEIENNLVLANCLMFLSQGGNKHDQHGIFNSNLSRVFECKTCNRQFASFQALGGHRASHKKPKLIDGDSGSIENQQTTKPKTHKCPICGVEFTIGQALGGHMRRHRTGLNENRHHDEPSSLSSQEANMAPIVKKSNRRRHLCLDLNLTPLENNLELLKLGKAAPAIKYCLF
ncbi:hypothetical protein V6N11_084425 [Hibiscus sabdariffa]|uniref:Uncharacterized protein n=2 Tax=Hibiscus sabdariffa TaxID=183260 RepID=A0ABR2B7A4_9ROSI